MPDSSQPAIDVSSIHRPSRSWQSAFFRNAALALCAGLALAATPAAAQTNPRVLVIFDTSGSMLWDYLGNQDCQGDNSVGFPERCPLDSRMRLAKGALRSVVEANPAVQFGLMRYGQLEPGDPGFGNQQRLVGAQYRDQNGNAIAINYDGVTNGCGPADLLVPPGAANNAQVLSWMDDREDYPRNKELRANGYTPLTHSMQTAREEVARLIAANPISHCEPYYVLLLTDGYQQCPGADAADPAYRAQVGRELVEHGQALRRTRVGGVDHDVRTFVVGFGPQTAFATELDQLARAGGTAINARGGLDLANGSAYQANDAQALSAALAAAVDRARPQELCNTIDDDCDGRVDEDFPQLGRPCAVGQGVCRNEGQIVCAPNGQGTVCSANAGDPAPEVCDGVDNDCDGRVDEGVLNACGACGPVMAEICDGQDNDCDGRADEGVLNRCGECGPVPAEVCDRVDNDCDGRVDEGVLNACGECGPVPAESCNCLDDDCDGRIDEHDPSCPPCDCTPQPETCNGLDDDCDGVIDEGVRNRCGQCGPEPVEICNRLDDDCDGRIDEDFPERGEACGNAEGACTAGAWRCVDGDLHCAGGTGPSQEVCGNRIDDDCDGRIDEEGFNMCGWCGPTRSETCDNIDNDCDGNIDDGDPCRADTICINGECVVPCEFGECFNDLICFDGHCVSPCRNTDCPSGWVCHNGECNDPCDGIPCPDGTYCTLGACVSDDCYGVGCADGELCRGGMCVPDPCAGLDCGPDRGCFDGRCFEDCRTMACPDGTLCVQGECVVDECARVSCPFPQTCVEGRCVDDPCFAVACPVGRICVDGGCVEDPCLGMLCPEDQRCHRGRCVGGDAPGGGGGGLGDGLGGEGEGIGGPDGGLITRREGDAGGGISGSAATDGCNCAVESTGGPSGAALLLLALAGLRPRRRRPGH